MGQNEYAAALALALVLAPAPLGCATKIYQGPTSGRGAEQQLAVSGSAEGALKGLKVEPFAGKRVAVRVYGLTERGGATSAEEDSRRPWEADGAQHRSATLLLEASCIIHLPLVL